MTQAVLSIGSNLGDRLARLQSAVDGFGAAIREVSPVYETEAWGAVDQGRFLNAVLIVEDPAIDGPGWLRWAHEIEEAADRVRGERWGPRTLDIDVISCCDMNSDEPDGTELLSRDNGLTLPHPLAHLRAFVMVPWLAVEPAARLTVTGRRCPVADLLDELEPADRTGPRLTDLVLQRREWPDPPGAD